MWISQEIFQEENHCRWLQSNGMSRWVFLFLSSSGIPCLVFLFLTSWSLPLWRLFLYVPRPVITLLITDQADQVPVFAKLASSESSRESGDGFPCPDNCSCHGSNIRCGSLEVTAASSTSTSTISYPFFTSSSSTTEDTEDLYLDDHSAAVSSSLPSSVPVDSNELSVLSKRLNRLSKHLNRLSKQMNKLSKQMSECMAAASKTGKHGVKCYN